MESSYQQAYKILKFVDEQALEQLNLSYKYSCDDIKKLITENEDLNTSRAKTKTAIELLNGGYLTSTSQGKNIIDKLNQLKEYGREMDRSSRELRTMLDNFNDFYIKNSEKFSNDLLVLFEQLSEGKILGDTLINDGKNLAKKIENFINNDLMYEINVFKSFIDKKTSYFYPTIDSLHNEIQKIDEGRLPSLRYCVWTDLEYDDLFLKPAYRNNEI